MTKIDTIPSSTIAAGSGLAVVTWVGGAAPFQVQARSGFAGQWVDVGGITYANSQTNILTSQTAYYRVVGITSFSSRSDKTKPTNPSGLTLTAVGSTQVNLSWNASTDAGGSGLKGYNVNRNGIFLKQVAAPVTSMSDVGVMPSATYSYSVFAVDNAYNQSSQSASASITTPASGDTTPPMVSLSAPLNGATVSNTISLAATASDNVGVTRVEFYRDGTTLVGTDTASPFSVSDNTLNLSNGSHTYSARAFDAASNSTLSGSASVTVNNPPPPDTAPPAVSLTAPSNGSTVSNTITLTASASDNVGVTRVDFYRDGSTWVGMDTVAPFSVSDNTANIGNGTHSYFAQAFDAAGNSALSASVSVTVNNPPPPDTVPPTVSLTAPSNGSTVSNTITLTASASDNVGVTLVEFYRDGVTLVGGDAVAPFSLSHNTTNLSNGSHSYIAKAYDAAGNSTISASVSVTVNNPPPADTTPPSVSMTAPANGSTVSNTITLTASASDNVGVTRVEFYRDGLTLIGAATVSPFSVSDNTTNVANGSHSYSARAYDAATNSTLSASVSVTVSNPPPADTASPSVSLTAPANGSTLSNTITLTATATDNVTVARVEFYRDGATLVGTAATTPYSLSLDTASLANGSHAFYAKAFDPAGNWALSVTNTVTVTNSTAQAAVPGQLQWVKGIAAPNGNNASGNAIATDAVGNVIVGGDFNGGVDFGVGVELSGQKGLFIAKYNNSGSLVFGKAFVTSASSSLKSVRVDAQNNILICGSFGGTADFGGVNLTTANQMSMYVAKYTPSGSLIWVRSFGGGFGLDSDFGSDLAVDANNNVVMVGRLQSANVDFGSGITLSGNGASLGSMLSMVKLSPGGVTIWAKAYGTGFVDAKSVAMDRVGDIVVTGQFKTSSDFGGGAISSPNSGYFSSFVAKYSGSNGAYQWARAFGGSNSDGGFGIAADPITGNVVVTGSFSGTADFGGGAMTSIGGGIYLVGYTPAGNYLWALTYGTSSGGANSGTGLAFDANGNLALTGVKSGYWFINGAWVNGGGALVQVYTLSGNTAPVLRWQKWPTAATAASAGCGIAFDSQGHVLTTGWLSYGSVDFGGQTITSTPNSYYGFVTQYTR